MKFNRFNYFLLLMGFMAVTGCVSTQTVTTVTAPDGTVTRTETKQSGPDGPSVTAAANAAAIAAAFIPRPRVIVEK